MPSCPFYRTGKSRHISKQATRGARISGLLLPQRGKGRPAARPPHSSGHGLRGGGTGQGLWGRGGRRQCWGSASIFALPRGPPRPLRALRARGPCPPAGHGPHRSSPLSVSPTPATEAWGRWEATCCSGVTLGPHPPGAPQCPRPPGAPGSLTTPCPSVPPTSHRGLSRWPEPPSAPLDPDSVSLGARASALLCVAVAAAGGEKGPHQGLQAQHLPCLRASTRGPRRTYTLSSDPGHPGPRRWIPVPERGCPSMPVTPTPLASGIPS